LVPTVAALGVFGVLAHEVARRTLEDELGRRLGTAATGVALTVLPEQILELTAGDEGSLTYANVWRKLQVGRERFGVRRVLLVADDLTGRGDTDERVALGAPAHEISADRLEIDRARGGTPSASLLFVGHDQRPYKRAYAVIGGPGESAAGFAVVEGSADYFQALAAFRRWLISGGAVALLVVMTITVVLARRITGPVARLAGAASLIGRGELGTRVPVERRDEIGLLAATLDDMRASLQARDERLQMMLAGIAHEVRNPLGGLELYAGLLRDALGGQPERLQEVARIERELAYLKTVVTEFLDYARRPPLELTSVPLAPLLAEVRELAATAGSATVDVGDVDGIAVRADAGQLRRALLNLARNAVTAASARDDIRGRVALTAARNGDRVFIEVSDNGPGVAPELRDKIFTPFFTTREKGTGLGLAFVRETVRDHGGEVVVDSAPGGGARFRLELPAGS
jgi:signal transduction histidine kinase